MTIRTVITRKRRKIGLSNGRPPALSLCAMLLLLLLLAACGGGSATTGSHAATTTPAAQVQATQSGQQKTYGPPAPSSPTPVLKASALHGPTNFTLNTPLNFSTTDGTTKDASGNSVQLDNQTVQSEINGELRHLLFVVSANGDVTVYTPGSSQPIVAQVQQNSDGTTSLGYTQNTNSTAGSTSLTFSSLLENDQITATYEQDFSPVITSDSPPATVNVAFTTSVKWVASNQIPTAPEKGSYSFDNKGAVQLSWQGGGQNASGYDVYRLLPNQDLEFQLIATVKGSPYTDSSAQAIQQAHTTTGLGYAIFAVGPTGVENPSYVVISVTSK